MIDTSINPLAELQKATSEIKGHFIKLPDEDEKQLKSMLRVHEDSEILLRILKLFNLFFEKFSIEKKALEVKPIEEGVDQ